MARPGWWDWELAFTSHVEVRMEERGFSELELRSMLESPTSVEPSRRQGRWVVSVKLRGRNWTVVVEPDADEHLLYVVTAFPRGDR